MRTIAILTMMLMLAGCAEYQPVVWVGGTPDIEETEAESVGLRLGLKQGQIEAGYTSNWWMDVDNDVPQAHGIYGIYHMAEPIMVGPIETSLYAGIQTTVGGNDLTRVFAGTLLPGGAFIEYRRDMVGEPLEANMDDEDQIAVGWRIALK